VLAYKPSLANPVNRKDSSAVIILCTFSVPVKLPSANTSASVVFFHQIPQPLLPLPLRHRQQIGNTVYRHHTTCQHRSALGRIGKVLSNGRVNITYSCLGSCTNRLV